MKTNKWRKMEVVFELLVFGLVIGIAEDLLAIKLATQAVITPRVIFIVVLVTIPFAVIGEAVFDRIDFAKIFQRMFEKGKKG